MNSIKFKDDVFLSSPLDTCYKNNEKCFCLKKEDEVAFLQSYNLHISLRVSDYQGYNLYYNTYKLVNQQIINITPSEYFTDTNISNRIKENYDVIPLPDGGYSKPPTYFGGYWKESWSVDINKMKEMSINDTINGKNYNFLLGNYFNIIPTGDSNLILDDDIISRTLTLSVAPDNKEYSRIPSVKSCGKSGSLGDRYVYATLEITGLGAGEYYTFYQLLSASNLNIYSDGLGGHLTFGYESYRFDAINNKAVFTVSTSRVSESVADNFIKGSFVVLDEISFSLTPDQNLTQAVRRFFM